MLHFELIKKIAFHFIQTIYFWLHYQYTRNKDLLSYLIKCALISNLFYRKHILYLQEDRLNLTVEIKGAKFLPSLFTCGITQGSIHGHLLFLIYINDLNQCSEQLKFIKFADDSTLYAKGKTLTCLTSKINQELKKVVKWLRINRLSLNVSKSSYTVFTNCSQTVLPQIIIDDISLEHSLGIKFLGILVDSKLNFASHIRNVCTKVSRAIGICNKLVMCEREEMKNLYICVYINEGLFLSNSVQRDTSKANQPIRTHRQPVIKNHT